MTDEKLPKAVRDKIDRFLSPDKTTVISRRAALVLACRVKQGGLAPAPGQLAESILTEVAVGLMKPDEIIATLISAELEGRKARLLSTYRLPEVWASEHAAKDAERDAVMAAAQTEAQTETAQEPVLDAGVIEGSGTSGGTQPVEVDDGVIEPEVSTGPTEKVPA